MYEKIRKIRNKLLYNGKPPLNFDCEVKAGSKIYKIGKNMYSQFEENLGKPVSLADILRMLQKDIETEYKGVSYFIESNGNLVKRLDGTYSEAGYTEDIIAYIDLTKEIKNQKKETLEKIYNLIK